MAEVSEPNSTTLQSDKAWIYVQKKTFTNWVNDKLKATEYQVKDLHYDLKDGMVLITLLQVLAPGKKMPGRYKTKPKLEFHMRENLTIAFQFMLKVEKIPLVNIGAMDIFQSNLKLILGLIWTLILRYQIAGPVAPQSPSKSGSKDKNDSKEQKSAKKLLLHWINVVIPRFKVVNFSDSWNNGLALSALVDYCKPGLIPNHVSLNPDNGLENIKNAMDIAEKELGVPQVMHPEDMAVEKPDELSVMTYVSGFSHQNSAGQRSLLIWINQRIPHHQVMNFSSDWTDGLALGALTDVISGGQLPEHEKMTKETPVENCRIVMQKAKAMLEIDLLATPEEFASESLNQLTRVSYLAQFQSCKRKSLTDFLTVSGQGVVGGTVGQKTTFVVSAARIPRWANIHAKVTTANGRKVEVKKESQTDNAVEFSYTPEEPDEYIIEIDMNDALLTELRAKHVLPTFPNKCKASGDGLKRAHVEKGAEFTVDCEQGGVGELQVSVQGPSNKLPIETSETKPQNYHVTYTPKEIGTHEITINWGDEPIPESPFQSTVTDPSKCTVSGLTEAHVNVQQTFTVDASGAGQGDLSVKCRSPSGDIPVEVSRLQNQTSRCTYVPREPGEHVIDIFWSDRPIAGSPYKVNAVIPVYTNKCKASGDGLKRACVGKRAEFTVDCEQGGVGELQVTVQGPNSKVPVTKEEMDKPQNFLVSYTPDEVGTHKITIDWGDNQIPESPFQCAVIDPSKCTVEGLTETHINIPHTFTIDTSSAGPGELSVKCQGPISEISVEVNTMQNQVFSCTFTPQEPGEHVFNIYWSDHPVPQSPLRVNAIVPTYSDKCRPSGDGLKKACVGKRAEFTVDCEQGGVGELQVTVQGPNSKVPVTKEEADKPQNFLVSYAPDEVGAHDITINWGENQISESPFQCAVTDPSKCTVSASGDSLTQAFVNIPQTFTVDTSNAGPGELSVQCQGPISEIPVEVNKMQNQVFSCTFTPQEPGEHVFNIYWSDHPVPQSPLRVNAIVPTYSDKCRASGDGLKRACVGKRAEFTVDCEQGGVGELQVTVQGPNSKVPVTKKQTDKPQNFHVSYTPEEVGTHEIIINWGDSPIPESPFQCAVIDPNKCTVSELLHAPVNVLQTFIVDTNGAGPGELSIKCHGPVGEVPVDITKLQNGSYSCSYTPQDPGKYSIDICWSDFPITDSPIQATALAYADPSKCTIANLPEVELHVGTSYTFNVLTGQPDHAYNLTISSKSNTGLGNSEIDCNSSTGICTVRFSPSEPGPLLLNVICNGTAIPSAPVFFNVIDLSKPVQETVDAQIMQNIEETFTVPAGLVDSLPMSENTNVNKDGGNSDDLVIQVGEPLTLVIDLESGYLSKKITAIATGQNTGPIEVPVVKNADNTITVSFSPSKPDRYSIQLKADDDSVPTGPFSVTFIKPVKPRESLTAVWKPDEDTVGPEKVSFKYSHRNMSAQIKLSVDSSQAEASDTTISVLEASTTKPVASSLSEHSNGSYNLEFTTTNEQEYTIVLTYLLKVSQSASNKIQLIGTPSLSYLKQND